MYVYMLVKGNREKRHADVAKLLKTEISSNRAVGVMNPNTYVILRCSGSWCLCAFAYLLVPFSEWEKVSRERALPYLTALSTPPPLSISISIRVHSEKVRPRVCVFAPHVT